MFEAQSDQLGGGDGCLAGRENRAWSQLVRKLQLKDTFSPRHGHLRFSWDSMRLHRHNPANGNAIGYPGLGNRTLRRLDRIYLTDSSLGPRLGCSSTILPGFAFSDHAPVWAEMVAGERQRRPTRFRMNPSHFINPVYKERIRVMWERGHTRGEVRGWSPFQTLNKCIIEAGKIDRSWGKRLAMERRFYLDMLQARLSRAQLALESAPDNDECQMAVLVAREGLMEYTSHQTKWVDFILQSRWAKEGDRGTRIRD